MKNYKGFYREAKGNLPHIYCDMDGVLTDFVLAAKKATGQNWEGMRHGQDWDSIKNTKNFWSNMPWMRDGKKLWGVLKCTVVMLQCTIVQYNVFADREFSSKNR